MNFAKKGESCCGGQGGGKRIRESNGIWWICQIRGLSYLFFKEIGRRSRDVQTDRVREWDREWDREREERERERCLFQTPESPSFSVVFLLPYASLALLFLIPHFLLFQCLHHSRPYSLHPIPLNQSFSTVSSLRCILLISHSLLLHPALSIHPIPPHPHPILLPRVRGSSKGDRKVPCQVGLYANSNAPLSLALEMLKRGAA